MSPTLEMDAIIAVNENGCVTLFNRAAERVFRCAASMAIGQPCKRFLSERLCREARRSTR